MGKQLMIKEVAKNYNITKRTLRYYEEIGLLTNVKKNDSNYRYYDDETLNRLEQILLLRDLNFHISEIRDILVSEDDDAINKILYDKLKKLQDDIDSFFSLKKTIASIINIKNASGIRQVSLYQILKEQIYIHKNMERVFEMSQFVGDVIIVEFGVNLIECADTIINNIKKLRQDIKSEMNKEFPLIRIKDNVDLIGSEYKIIIKGITVRQGILVNGNVDEKASIIIEAIKEALICNIHNIAE